MTFTSHDTKISLVYEEKNAFMHEYYHSTTVKYSESAPKWVLPIWPPRPTSGFKNLMQMLYPVSRNCIVSYTHVKLATTYFKFYLIYYFCYYFEFHAYNDHIKIYTRETQSSITILYILSFILFIRSTFYGIEHSWINFKHLICLAYICFLMISTQV